MGIDSLISSNPSPKRTFVFSVFESFYENMFIECIELDNVVFSLKTFQG